MKRAARLWILAVGWLAFVLYCYPGYMSADSSAQLAQARGLDKMSNWHPPVMAYLWKLCDAIWPGPFLMLVVQSVCFLAGVYLILRRVLSDRGAQIAAALILLSPPVIPPMGVIWKDSQMAGFLILAIGIMASQRRAAQLAGCALAWLATAQRYNAAAATLPVMLGLFVWKPELVRWKRYALATGVWIAITVSSMWANSALTEDNYDVFGSLAGNDIIGIIHDAGIGEDELAQEAPGLPWLRDTNHAADSAKMYRPYFTWLDWSAGYGVLRFPSTPEDRAAFAGAWRRLIVKHPLAYLTHRARVFFTEIRVTHRWNFYIWYNVTDGPWTNERLNLHHEHTAIQDVWIDFNNLFVNTPLFWAWIYMLGGFALCYLLRRDRFGLTLVTSGLACELGLFIAAPAVDYRYSHWMVTATIVAAVYYIGSRRTSRVDVGSPRS